MNRKEKMEAIRLGRLKELEKLTGVSIDKVIDNLLCDLAGCYSGGSDERLFSRQWFLRNDGNYSKPENYLAIDSYLNSLQEPTVQQLENDDIDSFIPRAN